MPAICNKRFSFNVVCHLALGSGPKTSYDYFSQMWESVCGMKEIQCAFLFFSFFTDPLVNEIQTDATKISHTSIIYTFECEIKYFNLSFCSFNHIRRFGACIELYDKGF